jgi:hypothetical protein
MFYLSIGFLRWPPLQNKAFACDHFSQKVNCMNNHCINGTKIILRVEDHQIITFAMFYLIGPLDCEKNIEI